MMRAFHSKSIHLAPLQRIGRISVKTILAILTIALLATRIGPARAVEAPATRGTNDAVPQGWLEGWRFRVLADAKEKAESYDITVRHDGLARPDARDVRVLGPGDQPVSLFVVDADPVRFRVLVDGINGPGVYQIFIGNLVAKNLPPVPRSITPFGRRDWLPQGGYTCASMDPIEKISPEALTSPAQVREAFATIQGRIEKATTQQAADEPDVAKRKQFVLTSVHRSTFTDIANIEARELLRDENIPAAKVPQNWMHVFRAQIDVATAGSYEFVVGGGQPSALLGVLIIDGNWEQPAVGGWYTDASGGASVIDALGKADLTAGKHVLELYTNRNNPDIKWTPFGSGKVAEYLQGGDAHFDNTLKLSTSDFEAQGGQIVDAYLQSIRDWSNQGRFAIARTLNRAARARLANDPTALEQLATIYAEAERGAFDRNWLTEGKFPSRAGAVDAAPGFTPPLRVTSLTQDTPLHDQRHISSAALVEGKLLYGLPYDVQDVPWAVTSGICVGDDLLYIGTKNGVMHAVSISTQSERWTFPAGGSCLGSPLLYGENLYFGSLDRRLYALDAQRGRMIWNFPAKGWIDGSPCAAQGKIYFGSRDGNLYAIDAKLGIERWHAPLGGEIVATPCTDDTRIYVGTRSGTFFAVDAASGSVVWKFETGSPIVAGACVGSGRVCFADSKGALFALDAATGATLWKKPVIVPAAVIAPPVLVGEVLFGGCEDGSLWGIDVQSGEIGWTALMPQGGAVHRQPMFSEGKLIFVSRARDFLQPDGSLVGARGAVAVFEPAPGEVREIFPGNGAEISEVDWNTFSPITSLLKPTGLAAFPGVQTRIGWTTQALHIRIRSELSPVPSPPGDAAPLATTPPPETLSVVIDPRGDGLIGLRFSIAGSTVKGEILPLPPAAGDVAKAQEAIAALKLDPAWSPTWSGSVTPNPAGGWEAAIVIPFDSLPAPFVKVQAGTQWKVNLIAISPASTGLPALALSAIESAGTVGVPARWPTLKFAIPPVPAK